MTIIEIEVISRSSNSTALTCSERNGRWLIIVYLFSVPSDVFSVNSVWKGFYEYLGKQHSATLTVDYFNNTSSKVNGTFLDTNNSELKLSGKLIVMKCCYVYVLESLIWFGFDFTNPMTMW